jgi:hypothetical protein
LDSAPTARVLPPFALNSDVAKAWTLYVMAMLRVEKLMVKAVEQ